MTPQVCQSGVMTSTSRTVRRFTTTGSISLVAADSTEPTADAALPQHEAWLWQNPAALASVQRGIAQAARGEVVSRGSFAQYLDDED